MEGSAPSGPQRTADETELVLPENAKQAQKYRLIYKGKKLVNKNSLNILAKQSHREILDIRTITTGDVMDSKKYRYNHIGIPTTKKLKNEKYLVAFDIYTAGYQENEFNIEWMKYGPKCKIPNIVKELPHVAFEVDDIYEAIKGHKVIIEPNTPGEGAIVAFVLINDAPVEFIQFTDRELCEKNYKKLVKEKKYGSE